MELSIDHRVKTVQYILEYYGISTHFFVMIK